MVLEKGEPALAGVSRRGLLRQVARYRGLEISNPNFKSSPWIRGASHVRFSATIDSMRLRSSGVIFGRPGWRGERKRSPRRSPGFTITNTLARFDQIKWGLAFLRLRMPTCCRKATSSKSQVVSEPEEGPEPREKSQKKPDHRPS